MSEYRANYNSQDEIPESIENFRELFTEKNGKWELTGLQGVKTTADVERIEAAKRNEVTAHSATKADLEAWKEMGTPEEVQGKLDRMVELEAAAEGKLDDAKIEELAQKRAEGMVRSQIAPLERDNKKLTRENGELTEQNTGYLEADRKRTVHDGLRQARMSLKALEGAEPDILRYDSDFIVTDEGQVVTKEGALSPESWLQDMQPNRAHWWGASVSGHARGANGAPLAGHSGPNPWASKTWNMTQQEAVRKEIGDERAGILAQQAGVELDAIEPARE